MTETSTNQFLEFTSGGFELYVPPTPFSNPPGRTRFVMLDDLNNVFYDVDYESSSLNNSTPWTKLGLHNVADPAIVFPPNQWQMFEENSSATGFLVLIQSRDSGLFTATKIGTVYVRPLLQEFMNWGVLESLKGSELPSEMRAGLLRHVFNRRPGANARMISYVTLRRVLDNMHRPWHQNGAWLNWELDDKFTGGSLIGNEQMWKLGVHLEDPIFAKNHPHLPFSKSCLPYFFTCRKLQ